MELKDIKYNLIQKFLRDDLSPKEKLQFDEFCKDAEYRKELLYQASVLESLEEGKNLALKKFFNALAAEEKNPTEQKNAPQESKRPAFYGLWKYAAAILLLIGIVVLWRSMQPADHLNQFAAHYQTYPATLTPRGNEKPFDENFQVAMQSYTQNNYTAALQLLNALPSKDENVLLYQASCLLELKKYEAAEKVYNQLVNSSDQEKRQVAEWYLMLVQLVQNKTDLYHLQLQKIIANPAHLFYAKAKSLQAASQSQ